MTDKWSNEETAYLKLIYKRFTAKEVVKKINKKFRTNRSTNSIYIKAHKEKLSKENKENLLSISDVAYIHEINVKSASTYMKLSGGFFMGQKLVINNKNIHKIEKILNILNGESDYYIKISKASKKLGFSKKYLTQNFKKNKISPIYFLSYNFITKNEFKLLSDIMWENNNKIDWEYFKKRRIKERVVI